MAQIICRILELIDNDDYCRDPQDVDVILTAPETQDEGVWKYEHLR